MSFFAKLDELNEITDDRVVVRWLERLIFVFMTLMTIFAPHSIAGTQIGWILGMLAWLIVSFMRPRRAFADRALFVALIAFFGWSVVSSAFSYAPDISLDKLRGVSLFLICLFVAQNLRTTRAARFLALALITSAMVAVVWTPIERAIGRGVQIYDFKGSAFDQIGLQDGDVLLTIDGKKVNSLDEARRRIAEHQGDGPFKALVSRADAMTNVEIPRERITNASTAEESLGVKRWNRSRNWRAAGFYGHFTTFAEVMQLIASLTLGLFVAVFSRLKIWRAKDAEASNAPAKLALVLGVCVALMAVALLLTVTRASQLGFLISGAVIVLFNGNRRLTIALAALALPAALVGLFVLKDMRRVSFFDSNDNSTTWRQTVYREGFDLWTKSPRNFTFGVGMDSIKRYAAEWHLFDDGRLPMGHFHSTPLQLAVERGLPALLIWLTVLGLYFRRLRRGLKAEVDDESDGKSAIDKGILLGALGGMVGFFASGLVHYNLGDGEVAMAFFLIMGIAVRVANAEFKMQSSK